MRESSEIIIAKNTEVNAVLHRFHTLVGLMLSTQTRDQITAAAMEKLTQRNLSIESVESWSLEELEQMIYPVGFYRQKAK
jgi:endonuclease-3